LKLKYKQRLNNNCQNVRLNLDAKRHLRLVNV